jgi:multicomponent Na+:H+ antiporter subunit D
MFLGHDSHIKAKEPPTNMLIGMLIAAVMCVVIGIFPRLLYDILPYPVDFEPYTGDHITGALGLLLFTALGFYLLLDKLHPAPHITLDTDWFYRKGSMVLMWFSRKPVSAYEGFITEIANTAIMPFIYAVARIGFWIDRNIVDKAVNGVAGIVMSLSAGVRKVQSGLLQHYAVGMVLGIMVIIFIFSVIVRG